MKSLNLTLIIISGSIMISRLIKYYPYSNWSLLIIFIFGFLSIFFLILFFLNNELSKKVKDPALRLNTIASLKKELTGILQQGYKI